ncbi:MAG TPA: hypothetical protein DHW32_08405 [Ruminococcaceae bacterium]|nr:hypothetical protein [Oscillospiraceae bacterium]HCK50740.1 hypothetical protein [Oscillospiraceae bacterium]
MKCLNIAKTTIPTKTEPVQIVITHANVQAIVVYAFTKYTISIVILAQDTAIIADFSRITMYANTLSNTHQK